MKLNANGEQPPINIEGSFIKVDIEAKGKEILFENKIESDGQNFYRQFIKIDVNNESIIQATFCNKWKKTVFDLCNNDKVIVDYINLKYPTKNKV